MMGLMLALGSAFQAAQAQITFAAPGSFTDDSVLITGPLVYAVNPGAATDTPVTVGSKTILFQADNSNLNSNVSIAPTGGNFVAENDYLTGGGTSGNLAFDTVLNNGAYNSNNAGATITLNNLVVNRSYRLELFVADTRSNIVDGTFTVTSGSTTTAPQQYAYYQGTPALGGYITGTFTAASTTQSLYEELQVYTEPGHMGPYDQFQLNGLVLDVANYNLELTPGLTPNQLAVATNLDSDPFVGGAIGTVISEIGNGPTDQIGSDLDQLSPEKLQIFRNIAFDNFVYTATAVDNHLASLRYGQGGFDSSGLSVLNPTDSPLMSQIKGRLLAFDAPDSNVINDSAGALLGGVTMTDPKDVKDSKQMATEPEGPSWSGFIDGTVILADLSHNVDDSHASYTTGGVNAGVDYRFSKNFAAGAMFGYGHTYATLDENGSHARVDSYSPGLYATYADKGFFLNGIASYDYNNYSEARAIPFAGLESSGKTHGSQFNGDIDGGYEFHHGDWTFGPTLALQYVHLEINDFTESGAAPVNLSIANQQDDSLRSRLGGELRYEMKGCGNMVFTPHLSASWQHEYLDNARGITSQFNDAGLGSFSVEGTNTDRDSAFIDVGANAQFNKALSGFLDYETQVGQDNFYAQAVQAGLKVSF
jgi:outer membrane autotransporter protein